MATPTITPMNGERYQEPNANGKGDETATALLPPPWTPARRILLCADSGYRHFLAVIPKDRRLDLDSLSHLLGGARLQIASPCACGSSEADFRLDTIIDTTLAGHDFELEFESGAKARIRYAEFEHQCHPQVAAISLSAAN